MKKKNIISWLLLSFFSLAILLLLPLSHSSAVISDPVQGLNLSANQVDAFEQQTAKQDSEYKNFVAKKAGSIVGLILSFVGALFLILMIYAGITWMTSQGNEQKISQAKSLIIDAIIGLIIVFAAYALTTFLGGEILR